MKILSLQGINELPHNYNYEILKSNFKDAEIHTYDSDLKNVKPSAVIHDCMLDEYDLIVANCFGGFYGYIIGGLQDIPTLLINPMIPPEGYVLSEYPEYRFKNQLPGMWQKYRGINKKVYLYLGDNDVTIDCTKVIRQFKYISVNHFEDGHTLISDMFEYNIVNTIKNLIKY